MAGKMHRPYAFILGYWGKEVGMRESGTCVYLANGEREVRNGRGGRTITTEGKEASGGGLAAALMGFSARSGCKFSAESRTLIWVDFSEVGSAWGRLSDTFSVALMSASCPAAIADTGSDPASQMLFSSAAFLL